MHTPVSYGGIRLWVPMAIVAFTMPARAVPSFPGAEGWGAVTPGGRGGSVLHVTNLNDSGQGSFRAACEAAGPRTVVFDLSGIIHLAGELSITNPFVTIAGQTAPGEGIIIAGETVSLDTHDVIVRYMRFRRGETNYDRRDDALGSDATTGNIVIDHVSASWGLDENMSVYRNKINPPILPGGSTVLPTRNVTIQWSISSEALNPFRHAFGSTLGGAGVNHHHNLWACNSGRNPSISFSHFMDFRNNVLFNWMHRSVDGAGPEAHVNMINNYYKSGAATGFSNDVVPQPIPWIRFRIIEPEIRAGVYVGGVGWWYVDGNVVEGYPAVTSDNWEGEVELGGGVIYHGVQFEQPFPNDWARVLMPHTHVVPPDDPDDPNDDDGTGIVYGTGNPLPIDLPKIATQSALDAYASVLAGAGATLPVRDAVDMRVTNMVVTGVVTNGPRGDGIIDHPDQVGGYPVIAVVSRPPDWDSDGDGMPDDWEIAHGLDPRQATDGNGDYDEDGYTNLEEYLNELGAFKAVHELVWDGEVDGRYARIANWDLAFQPSRFDDALISNATVIVDAIGQDAGVLRLSDSALLDITNGWLQVADRLLIGSNCTAAVSRLGTLNVSSNLVNEGTLRLSGAGHLNVAGVLTNNGLLDIMTWSGELPAGWVNNGTVLDRRAIRVESVDAKGADFAATIHGYAGHGYQLQSREDLLSGTWQNVGVAVAGAGAPITLTDAGGAVGAQRLYRILVAP